MTASTTPNLKSALVAKQVLFDAEVQSGSPTVGKLEQLGGDLAALKSKIPVPTIVFLEHYWNTVTHTTWPIMRDLGLPMTYAAVPSLIDNGAGNGGYVASFDLARFQDDGNEVGFYTNQNMITYLNSNGSTATQAFFQSARDTMATKGFDVVTVAPNQRSWNSTLATLAGNAGFQFAPNCAGATGVWQDLLTMNLLDIENGATNSLKSDPTNPAADTYASLEAQLAALQASNGAWFLIFHKVAADGDVNYSVDPDVFAAFARLVVRERDAGRLRVCRMRDITNLTFIGGSG